MPSKSRAASGILLAKCDHECLTRAFQLADATVVVPMDFLRLPLIAMAGYFFYGETVDAWVIIGALILCAGAWLNIRAAVH